MFGTRFVRILGFCAGVACLAGCGGEKVPQSGATLRMGVNDNPEDVCVIPNTNEAIVVSSKARKLTRVAYRDGEIHVLKTSAPLTEHEDDEITTGVVYDENIFLATRTILRRDGSGKINDCAGELLVVSLEDETFGSIFQRVEVGPMPDNVAMSGDKKWAVTADERDSEAEAWGKCTVTTEEPSVSIIALNDPKVNPERVRQIIFTKNAYGPREPEQVAIASDNDTVAVTLQDSHEVAIFSIAEVVNAPGEVTESDVNIILLPTNASGQRPWPDGIIAIDIGEKTYFAVAGEWNDTLIILDKQGQVVSNTQIPESDVPTSFPCIVKANTPRYSPDSLTSYVRNGKTYLAATLRHTGAVIVYDISTPASPKFSHIFKVGLQDKTGCDTAGSVVRPEGIDATSNLIWIANEDEGSVTVIEIP